MHGRESHDQGQTASESVRLTFLGVTQAQAEAYCRALVKATGQHVTLRKFENGQQVPMRREELL